MKSYQSRGLFLNGLLFLCVYFKEGEEIETSQLSVTTKVIIKTTTLILCFLNIAARRSFCLQRVELELRGRMTTAGTASLCCRTLLCMCLLVVCAAEGELRIYTHGVNAWPFVFSFCGLVKSTILTYPLSYVLTRVLEDKITVFLFEKGEKALLWGLLGLEIRTFTQQFES